MSAAYETAYPRLKATVAPTDLVEVYSPTAAEFALAVKTTSHRGARLGFLVLLKTFQRLGYFVLVGEVPHPIVQHVARSLGVDPRPGDLHRYDESGTRRRHIPIIRAFLNVRPFNSEARALVATVVGEAALTKEDLADLMNVAIEELVRNRFRTPRIHDLAAEARDLQPEEPPLSSLPGARTRRSDRVPSFGTSMTPSFAASSRPRRTRAKRSTTSSSGSSSAASG